MDDAGSSLWLDSLYRQPLRSHGYSRATDTAVLVAHKENDSLVGVPHDILALRRNRLPTIRPPKSIPTSLYSILVAYHDSILCSGERGEYDAQSHEIATYDLEIRSYSRRMCQRLLSPSLVPSSAQRYTYCWYEACLASQGSSGLYPG